MQAIDSMAHELGHAANVGRHDWDAPDERFLNRQWRVLVPEAGNDDGIEACEDFPDALVVVRAMERHTGRAFLADAPPVAFGDGTPERRAEDMQVGAIA